MGTAKFVMRAAAYLIGHSGALRKMQKLKSEGKTEEKDKILTPLADEVSEKALDWAGLTLEIEGLENIPEDETSVFVANHQSGALDALVMLNVVKGHRPCGFLMKDSLEKIPVVAAWTKALDCVFVDRENPREAVKALNKASEQLKNGINMVIFPEGTRTKSYPVMGQFKNGAFKIAQKNKTPIVPVVLFDTGIRMEAAGGKLTSGTVHVKVLPPVHTKTMDRAEYKNIAETVHSLIEAEMKEFYGENYRA